VHKYDIIAADDDVYEGDAALSVVELQAPAVDVVSVYPMMNNISIYSL
jgi:hypothetical protein